MHVDRLLDIELKPHGRAVVIDFYKKALPLGPPESMRLSDVTLRWSQLSITVKRVGKRSFISSSISRIVSSGH